LESEARRTSAEGERKYKSDMSIIEILIALFIPGAGIGLIVFLLWAIIDPWGVLFFLLYCFITLIIYLLYQKFAKVRRKKFKIAWNALPDEDKDIWNEISVEKPVYGNNIFFYSGFVRISGKAAFEKRFAKKFSILDYFRKEFKKTIPFPKERFFSSVKITPKGKDLIKERSKVRFYNR